LNVLTTQPEVDPKNISLVGHSEGTVIAPSIAIDNPTKVKNIVLMGTVAQNLRDLLHYQTVSLPETYARQVLDKNHTGSISIQQMVKDPVLSHMFVPSSVLLTFIRTNDTNVLTNYLINKFGNNIVKPGYVNIDKQLKPALVNLYENISAFNQSKCNNLEGCPVWIRSHYSLVPTLNIIDNVSNSTAILLLNGENDKDTPVQQAFLLQQKLTEVNHSDHTLITYPNLGHDFYPSSKWLTEAGPIQQYVLADLYSWLESHNGLTPLTTSSSSSYTSNTTNQSANSTGNATGSGVDLINIHSSPSNVKAGSNFELLATGVYD
jgi:uncharacterized protein